jgi:hypothetical protein
MRYIDTRTGYTAAGIVEVAGILWIFAYARQDDGYYSPTEVSHWEHASKGGGAAIAVVCIAFAAAIALAFVAQAVFPKRAVIRPFAVPLAVVYLLTLFGAFFSLTVGH